MGVYEAHFVFLTTSPPAAPLYCIDTRVSLNR